MNRKLARIHSSTNSVIKKCTSNSVVNKGSSATSSLICKLCLQKRNLMLTSYNTNPSYFRPQQKSNGQQPVTAPRIVFKVSSSHSGEPAPKVEAQLLVGKVKAQQFAKVEAQPTMKLWMWKPSQLWTWKRSHLRRWKLRQLWMRKPSQLRGWKPSHSQRWQLRIWLVSKLCQRQKLKSQSQEKKRNLKKFKRSHILVSYGRKIRTTKGWWK